MSELKRELRAEMSELQRQVHADMANLADRMVEQQRDMQTEFLRTIYVTFKQSEVQFRYIRADMSNADAAAEKRLSILEERLREIEIRLMMKPPEAA